MKTINVLKPKYRTQEILDEVKICLDKGWTGMGFKTIEFEEAWKEYTNLPHAHFIQSNTVGLHLALNVFKTQEGWEDGDEIITTPLTFVSTNHSILYEKLYPVFADVDEHLCLSPESVEKLITPKTRAVMYVGMGGNAGRLNHIKHICKEYNLKLILDAAHMAGTYTRDVMPGGGAYAATHCGWEADVSVFSFQAVKNLPTADSGMICFKDEKYDKLVRQLSWLGIDKDTYSRSDDKGSYKWKYDVPNVGFKYHGNSIMASIGLVQLKYLDEDNDYRNQISKWYDELLGDNQWIQTIPTSWHTHKSSKHLYQVLIRAPKRLMKHPSEKRDKVINKLYENKIYPGVHYVDNTLYPMYSSHNGTCPKADFYSRELITLPIHLDLKKSDCERVVNIIKEVM